MTSSLSVEMIVGRTPSLGARVGSGTVPVLGAKYRAVPGSDISGKRGGDNQQS